MRYKVLRSVCIKTLLFRDTTPYSFVDGYKYSGKICWPYLEILRILDNPENGGSSLLQNVDTDTNLPGYTASRLRRQETGRE
jgi:hypothetical protein